MQKQVTGKRDQVSSGSKEGRKEENKWPVTSTAGIRSLSQANRKEEFGRRVTAGTLTDRAGEGLLAGRSRREPNAQSQPVSRCQTLMKQNHFVRSQNALFSWWNIIQKTLSHLEDIECFLFIYKSFSFNANSLQIIPPFQINTKRKKILIFLCDCFLNSKEKRPMSLGFPTYFFENFPEIF